MSDSQSTFIRERSYVDFEDSINRLLILGRWRVMHVEISVVDNNFIAFLVRQHDDQQA